MYVENPYIQYMYSYPHKTAYAPLQNIDLRDYFPKLAGRENSLYFHIPFCQYKCGYCNLFSVAGQSEQSAVSHQTMSDYIDAMERQSAQLSAALPEGITFVDLTFGGERRCFFLYRCSAGSLQWQENIFIFSQRENLQ